MFEQVVQLAVQDAFITLHWLLIIGLIAGIIIMVKELLC